MSSDIKTIMLDVAKTVAEKAKVDTVPFAERIDALKALTAMYAALQKHPTSETDDKTGEGFDFSKGVEPDEEEPPDDTVTPIRARRRPG